MRKIYGTTRLEIETARREAYLRAWPAHAQLEAQSENAMGRPEKLERMKADFAAIKAQLPYPDEAPKRYEVRKMLVIERIPDEALEAFNAGIASLPLRDSLRWDSATMIAADDEQVRGFLEALSLDPDAILAPEIL